MTITSKDIVLFQAQDNTDNDSGGGSRTSSVIVDGDVNNLFPDISRIDTVVGRVNLRKVFPTITTDNRDVYYGAHSMIRKAPTDDKVSALLFRTDSPHDTRINAQNKIESYVVQSYAAQFYLYGNHVLGSKGITVLQTVESQTPDIGEVYLISEGANEQYVRIVDFAITEIEIPYTYGSSTTMYTRRRVDCQIDQVLEHDFTGSVFHPAGRTSGSAEMWETQIADAAKFYSAKDLSVEALANDLSIKVDSIYTRLVPAATSNSFLNNEQALISGQALVPTSNLTTEYCSFVANTEYTLKTSITPNSFTVTISGTLYEDDGQGNIIKASTGEKMGVIDYVVGAVTFYSITVSITVSYQVAATYSTNIQNTVGIDVTQENSSTFWSRRITPMPSIGNLYIDYRSQGKWYRITSTRDRDAVGVETLGSEVTIGTGTLSDNLDGTGTVNVTLGALPDIDSAIVFSWGTVDTATNRSGPVTDINNKYMKIALGQINFDPSSFSMQIYSPQYAGYRTVTANAEGTLLDEVSGLSGWVDPMHGYVYINYVLNDARFEGLPSSNDIIIDFDRYDVAPAAAGERKSGIFEGVITESSGVLTFNLGSAVEQHTVRLSFFANVVVEGSLGSYVQKREINLKSNASGILSGGRNFTGSVASNGDVIINMVAEAHMIANPAYTGVYGTEPKHLDDSLMATLDDNDMTYTYRAETPPAETVKTPINITAKYEDISTYHIHTFGDITGDVAFSFNYNNLYCSDGLVYASGIQVGTIDNSTGEIELSCFYSPRTFALDFVILFTDLLTAADADNIRTATFRTAANKLTTSSFQLIFRNGAGIQTATSDAEGNVTGTGITAGTIDVQTGLASIDFTTDVSADSIRYDAVAETSLPLDPELLGLNPVRLPSDGRVPVFKSGYVIVIFHEATTAVINGGVPVADQVNTLARAEQSYIEVLDVNGKRLDPEQYVADRANGTVTFSNPFNAVDKYGASLTAPFSIVDRIEDMRLATDVQINGIISINEGLSRAFPANETKVSSALVWGDTGARVYNIFSQEIWSSGSPVWSDSRIGDNTTAQYDDVNFPIQIDNKSSSAGRWAIIFTSSTSVKVVNEVTGEAIAGVSVHQSTGEDVAPINPATMLPYFTMPLLGFGTGWVTNNVIRLNTDSGDNNMWVIRTVESGALSELTDSIQIEVRGDAN